MNEYIVYTTEGCTSGPNSDYDIENCQVLGFIEGLSERDAANRLSEQHDCIRKAGFVIDNTIVRPMLTVSIAKDIKTVIDYLWTDEHKHFVENHHPKDHIFRVLKRLKERLI